jgi:hypothetical protein
MYAASRTYATLVGRQEILDRRLEAHRRRTSAHRWSRGVEPLEPNQQRLPAASTQRRALVATFLRLRAPSA